MVTKLNRATSHEALASLVVDFVDMSSRNKEIVVAYVNGSTYKELAEKYDISINRIAQIIRQYIFHARIYRIENE